MSAHRGHQLVPTEAGAQGEFGHIEGMDRERVPVMDRVVPRRSAAVVTIPRTVEILVAFEPHRVVVLSVNTNRSGLRALPARRDTS